MFFGVNLGDGNRGLTSRHDLEEQGLPNDCLDGPGVERFGDEKCWFGLLACQKPLRMTGNKDNRDFEIAQNLVHRFQTGAAIRELNIRQDEVRFFATGKFESFCMSPSNSGYAMTKTLDKLGQMASCERVVLNNENFGAV